MKRLFDTVVAASLLLFFSPLLCGVAVLVRWRMGAPVLFNQLRTGLHGRLFLLHKFRTMTNQRDVAGQLLPDGERLTKFGRLLRSTSIDELPELWNVLKGEMSMVGPRPLLPDYLPLYDARQARRHSVKPGLTGWAQVNGRNAISWDERFELDVWYVENRSFSLDLYIIWLTFRKLISREGISEDGQPTMRPFRGRSSSKER